MSTQQYTVKTPNPLFTGVRMGVQFTDGQAICDREKAVALVTKWGYACKELAKEHQEIDETINSAINDNPEDFDNTNSIQDESASSKVESAEFNASDDKTEIAESIVQPIIGAEGKTQAGTKNSKTKKSD